MASSVLQVRIDEQIRNQASDILNNLGLDMSSAVRLFLNRIIIEQGLPFTMTLPRNDESQSFDAMNFLETYNLGAD